MSKRHTICVAGVIVCCCPISADAEDCAGIYSKLESILEAIGVGAVPANKSLATQINLLVERTQGLDKQFKWVASSMRRAIVLNLDTPTSVVKGQLSIPDAGNVAAKAYCKGLGFGDGFGIDAAFAKGPMGFKDAVQVAHVVCMDPPPDMQPSETGK